MKGTIIDFDENEKVGLILSEDGNRYEFHDKASRVMLTLGYKI